MSSAVNKNAIAEFEAALESATSEFARTISGAIPGHDDLFDEEEDGKRRIDKDALVVLLDEFDEADGKLGEALADFDWAVDRAMRVLKRTLAREAAS